MWVRVDDGFIQHPKVTRAAELLGKGGLTRVVAVWLEAMCFSARNLTDGYISDIYARGFVTDKRPLDVLTVMALPDVKLMLRVPGGYRFHDYNDYQPSSEEVKAKREKDRARKAYDSARNPTGINAESDGTHRAPLPLPLNTGKEQRAERAARMGPVTLSVSDVRRHLLKAAHLAIDVDVGISDGDIADAVKVAAAKLRARYNGRAVTGIVNAARAQRQRLHA